MKNRRRGWKGGEKKEEENGSLTGSELEPLPRQIKFQASLKHGLSFTKLKG